MKHLKIMLFLVALLIVASVTSVFLVSSRTGIEDYKPSGETKAEISIPQDTGVITSEQYESYTSEVVRKMESTQSKLEFADFESSYLGQFKWDKRDEAQRRMKIHYDKIVSPKNSELEKYKQAISEINKKEKNKEITTQEALIMVRKNLEDYKKMSRDSILEMESEMAKDLKELGSAGAWSASKKEASVSDN